MKQIFSSIFSQWSKYFFCYFPNEANIFFVIFPMKQIFSSLFSQWNKYFLRYFFNEANIFLCYFPNETNIIFVIFPMKQIFSLLFSKWNKYFLRYFPNETNIFFVIFSMKQIFSSLFSQWNKYFLCYFLNKTNIFFVIFSMKQIFSLLFSQCNSIPLGYFPNEANILFVIFSMKFYSLRLSVLKFWSHMSVATLVYGPEHFIWHGGQPLKLVRVALWLLEQKLSLVRIKLEHSCLPSHNEGNERPCRGTASSRKGCSVIWWPLFVTAYKLNHLLRKAFYCQWSDGVLQPLLAGCWL